jgi:hypothetical protein
MQEQRAFPFDNYGNPREILRMTRKIWLSPLLAIFLSLSVGGVSQAADLTLEKCPAPVQAAIQSHAQGGTLTELKLSDRETGTIYIAEIDLGEKRDLKLHVAPDGTILKVREEIVFNQAPAPVRRMALGLLPAGCQITDVDKETVEGVTTFTIEIKLSETRKRKLIMQPDGQVLEEQEKEK